MIFDSECHISFRFNLKSSGAPWQPKIFDPKAMEGTAPDGEPEDNSPNLIQWMDHFSIDKAVIMKGFFRHSNQLIIDAIKRYPDRLVGFASYGFYPPDRNSPKQTQAALDELERGIAAGLCGVGELSAKDFGVTWEEIPLAMRPILEICRAKNLPALFHTGCTIYTHNVDWIYPEREDRSPGDPPYRILRTPNALYNPAFVEELAFDFPTVPLIIAHMGKKDLTFFEAALMVARRFPNVYLTSSNTTMEFFERAVKDIGPERVLFGTDWKRTNPDIPFDSASSNHNLGLKLIREAAISDPAKELILGKNLERLLSEVKP